MDRIKIEPLCDGPWTTEQFYQTLQVKDADGKAVATVRPRVGAWNLPAIAAVPQMLDLMISAVSASDANDGDSLMNAVSDMRLLIACVTKGDGV